MRRELDRSSEPKATPLFRADAVCGVCGRFGAYAFEGRNLCESCYVESGSCCPEFGKDDMNTADQRRDPTGKPQPQS